MTRGGRKPGRRTAGVVAWCDLDAIAQRRPQARPANEAGPGPQRSTALRPPACRSRVQTPDRRSRCRRRGILGCPRPCGAPGVRTRTGLHGAACCHGRTSKPRFSRELLVLWPVEGPAHSRLDRSRGIDQAFLDGTTKDRSVEVANPVVGVPGVGVSVEVDQSQRAVNRCGRPQFSQRDRVIPAEDQWHDARLVNRQQVIGDALEGLDLIAGHCRRIAGVDHRERPSQSRP